MEDKCREVETQIQEYLSGCLTDAKKYSMFAHIVVCPQCKQELAWQNGLKKAASSIMVQPPKELLGMIMASAKSEALSSDIIQKGMSEAFSALRSTKQTVYRAFIPVRSCLKLAYKCI